jgi:hypothetical protein
MRRTAIFAMLIALCLPAMLAAQARVLDDRNAEFVINLRNADIAVLVEQVSEHHGAHAGDRPGPGRVGHGDLGPAADPGRCLETVPFMLPRAGFRGPWMPGVSGQPARG